MASLRKEAEDAVSRAEDAEAKNKKLEHEILGKDQEITSLTHRLQLSEANLEKVEDKLKEAKSVRDEHEQSKTTNESLQRKIQLLEEELDSAEKNLKETTERCVGVACREATPPTDRFAQAPSDGGEGRAL